MADTVNTTEQQTTTTTANALPTNGQRVQSINDMYKASLDANKANLEKQYQQSMSNAQADRDAIAGRYTEQQNTLAAEYERQRRNNNLQAQVNGLNTGTGSQMALAQSMANQSNKATLAKAQAAEQTAADRNLSDLTTQYQIAVNEAIANNDYQKSAALLDEYNQQKADMNSQAQIQAQYGDFSVYAQMYGQEVADNMQKMWALQNPKLAYANGMITAKEYYQMVGMYPYGYNAGGGGGGTATTTTGTTGAPSQAIGDAYGYIGTTNDGKGIYTDGGNRLREERIY